MLRLADGEPKKQFSLADPARVVVDLAASTSRAGVTEMVGKNGVLRVRLGRPVPETLRVVVELDRASRPRSVRAERKGQELLVSWR
jgi:hypothetical protein